MEFGSSVFTIVVGILCTIQSSTSLNFPPYQLVLTIEDTTHGLVQLQCREETQFRYLNVHNVKFWLNRTSPTDPGLRERADVTVIETEDQLGIRFNLTRNFEGYYTCGRIGSDNGTEVSESVPRPLICNFKYDQE